MKVSKCFSLSAILFILVFTLMNTDCHKKSFNIVCNHEQTIKLGKDYYQPLIEALEKYRADNGNYPKNLSQMTPKYISSQVITKDDTYNSGELLPEIETRSEVPRPDVDSYIIKFYFRSTEGCYLYKGGNCSYYGDTKNWSCS